MLHRLKKRPCCKPQTRHYLASCITSEHRVRASSSTRYRTSAQASTSATQPADDLDRTTSERPNRYGRARGPPKSNKLGLMYIGPVSNSEPDTSDSTPNTSTASAAQSSQPSNTPYERHGQRTNGYTRDHLGRQVVKLANSSSAGLVAGALSHALRKERQVVLLFSGQFMILKALRVVTLANQFMRQHDRALTFTAYRSESAIGLSDTNPNHVCYTVVAAMRRVMAGEKIQRQPVQRVPFGNETNSNAMPVMPNIRGVPAVCPPPSDSVYDFSLDARQDWKKNRISEDLAFNVADMIYDTLVVPLMAMKTAASAESASTSKANHLAMSTDATEPQLNAAEERHPHASQATMQLSADNVQSITLFAALTLVQRRLQHEGHGILVMCTVYRNTYKPRLDQRDGFVYMVSVQQVPSELQSGQRKRWQHAAPHW